MDYKENLYARFISGELTEQEVKSLKASGEWEELDKIVKEMDKLHLPSYDKQKAYSKLKNSRINAEPKKEIQPRRIGSWILAAASIALLMGGLFWFSTKSNTFQSDAKSGFKLADNSKVILNNGSTLVSDISFLKNDRIVHLKGEAIFEVKSGDPFVVKAADFEVKVLGTKFNVEAWGQKQKVECYEGSVEVSLNDEKVVLNTMEAVHIQRNILSQIEAIENKIPLWEQGISKFQNDLAGEVFNEFERQYKVSVEGSIPNVAFTGSFDHSDIEKALSQICTPLNLKWNTTVNSKVVKISK